jgi:hypothetical protein
MAVAIQSLVIAGLDPAIHRAGRIFDSWMDARVRPEHDELKSRRLP